MKRQTKNPWLAASLLALGLLGCAGAKTEEAEPSAEALAAPADAVTELEEQVPLEEFPRPRLRYYEIADT